MKTLLIILITLSCTGVLKPFIPTSRDTLKNKKDSISSAGVKQRTDSLKKNSLQIDTVLNHNPIPPSLIDTLKKTDSVLINPVKTDSMTNTQLFLYILLSILGLGLFFFVFVMMLFKVFHKKRTTRQSLLLSWSLFFLVSILWIFIIWGLVAGLWASASFLISVIFLFIISIVFTIIAIKSK